MESTSQFMLPSKTSWTEDIFQANYTTEIPSLFEETGGNTMLTIIFIIVAVVFMITLLFVLAVFIDCRHQKLSKENKNEPRRHLLNINLPKFFKFRRFSNEEDSFVDKMYQEDITA